MNRKTYTNTSSKATTPWKAYEMDFINPGVFFEEEDNVIEMITLIHRVYPGLYRGKKWIKQDSSLCDSYCITITYRSQNFVTIEFDANLGSNSNAKASFNFIKGAAKKFSLQNTLPLMMHEIYQIERTKYAPKNQVVPWKVVDTIYRSHTSTVDIRTANSWIKNMTVAEARALFDYLKINIDFPF